MRPRDPIENQTRDFPACSAVPQLSAPPRTPGISCTPAYPVVIIINKGVPFQLKCMLLSNDFNQKLNLIDRF